MRREICPGKSKVDRDLYFRSWEKVTQRLGKFTNSSVMLVGLQESKDIERGVKELIEIGIKPTLIPFRPFDKCALAKHPLADPDELLGLSMIAVKELRNNIAEVKCFVGCEHCGACSLEKDLMDF